MTFEDLSDLVKLTDDRFADARRAAFSLHAECLAPDSPTANSEILLALRILTLIETSKNAIEEAAKDLIRLRSLINEKKV